MRVFLVELAAGQFDEDFLDEGRYLVEHVLELVDLPFLLVDVLLDFNSSLLVFRGLVQNPLLFLVVFLELLVFGPEVVVDINEVIDFLVQDVNIGEEVVVLFFSFDEGVLDLEDVGESSGLFDSVEGLVDNFHISLVVIDQFDFFLVVDDQFGQSLLEDAGSIVLDGTNLAGFDSAAFVQAGIPEFFVEFGQPSVVVGFIFLVLHFEVEHQILAHVAGILGGLDVFGEVVDLILCFFDVPGQTFEVVLVHCLFLSQLVDGISESSNLAHGFIIPFIILGYENGTISICFWRLRILVNISLI